MDRKDTYTSVFLKAAGQPHDAEYVKKFRAVWWLSTRGKDVGGLRMTDQCLEFVETKSLAIPGMHTILQKNLTDFSRLKTLKFINSVKVKR